METRQLFYLANMIHVSFCPEIKHVSIIEKIKKVKDAKLWLKIKTGELHAFISSWLFSRKKDLRKYIRSWRKISMNKKLRMWYLFWRI